MIYLVLTAEILEICPARCLTLNLLLPGPTAFAHELREFNRIWPADATPIAPVELQEFFYALQGADGDVAR